MTLFEVFGTAITLESVLGAIPGCALCYWFGWRTGKRHAREDGAW